MNKIIFGLKRSFQITTLTIICLSILIFTKSVRADSSDESVWISSIRKILKEYGLSDVSGIKISPPSMMANWNDPDYGKYYSWRVIGDTIPRWESDIFIPTPNTVTDGYYAFLTNLDIQQPNPILQEKAIKARDQYIVLHNKLESLRDFKVRGKKDKLERQKKIDDIRLKIKSAANNYAAYINKSYAGYGSIGQALIDYENPAYQLIAKSPDGLMLNYRTFNITPDLDSWMKEVSQGESKVIGTYKRLNLEDRNIKDNVELSTRSGKFDFDPNIPFGHEMKNALILNVPANEAQVASDLTERIELLAKNITIFSIQPGKWFNGSMVQAFGNGPWIDGPVKLGTLKLWGADGIFNQMPIGLLVVYEPTVKLVAKLGKDSELKNIITNATELRAGPFSFEMPSASILDQPNNEIVIIGKGKPQIIATLYNFLPNSIALTPLISTSDKFLKKLLLGRVGNASVDRRKEEKLGDLRIGCKGDVLDASININDVSIENKNDTTEVTLTYNGHYSRQGWSIPCVKVSALFNGIEEKNLSGMYKFSINTNKSSKPIIRLGGGYNLGEVPSPDHDSNIMAIKAVENALARSF
ncbi:MAG: hypothetical protein ACXVNF_06315 [Neobacillus sp.]